MTPDTPAIGDIKTDRPCYNNGGTTRAGTRAALVVVPLGLRDRARRAQNRRRPSLVCPPRTRRLGVAEKAPGRAPGPIWPDRNDPGKRGLASAVDDGTPF
jgi:hypothetical protein